MRFRFTPRSKPLNPAATHEAKGLGCAVFFAGKSIYYQLLSCSNLNARCFPGLLVSLFSMPGEGDAEVSKTASATAEDTETVTKTFGLQRAWATSCFGFPNQSVKKKYTNIQIQLLPYSCKGMARICKQDGSWQLPYLWWPSTWCYLTKNYVKENSPFQAQLNDILGPWKWALRVWASWRSSSRSFNWLFEDFLWMWWWLQVTAFFCWLLNFVILCHDSW